MAAGPAYATAGSLIAYDDADQAVAVIIVWSAGPGRPGIIEPLGGHPDHRGKGHGRALTVAGAAALRDLGASSAAVATPSSNAGGIATYLAAGFVIQQERRDRTRAAGGSDTGTPGHA